MTPEKTLKDELLKQNGVSAEKAHDLREKILARDKARVARMRRLMVYAWIAVVASAVIAFVVRTAFPDVVAYKPQLVPLLGSVWYGLFLLAVIFTVSLYVRERTLTMNQIQTSLAHIEEHLKRMAEKE